MITPKAELKKSYLPEKNQLKMYGLMWVFFIVTTGSFANFIFGEIYRSGQNHNLAIGFISSSLYSTIFIILFHLSWVYLSNQFPLGSKKYASIIHVLGQFLVAVVTLVIGFLLTPLFIDFHTVSAPPKNWMKIDLSIITLIVLTCGAILNTTFYVSDILNRTLKAEKGRIQSELSALRAQINPHFLFNLLNSIASLVRISPEKAEEVTEDLAELFRYSLRSGSQDITTVKNELESVDTYFRIEKARFGERISLKKNILDEIQSVAIPSLVLQPLVENCVKHGAGKMTSTCIIIIDTEKTDNGYLIHVSDNGPGFRSLQLSELSIKGTGLQNVNDRLRYTLGETSKLHIQKQSVSFLLPYSHLA